MTRTGENGIALVITLFLMAAMSALAVSLMFLAQTETSASRNYRTMSQARYAGEAGVHRALNYLSSTAYAPTVASLASLDTTVSPVTCASGPGCTVGSPIVLAPVAADSNHPDSAVETAYAALFSGASLSVGGGATVTYSATATLLSARSVTVYGGSPSVVQVWRIAATGTVPGTLPATVEVAAVLERDSAAAETYAIFATGAGCGAINIAGNVETGSYDSSTMTLVGGVPNNVVSSGGAVGTNGNLTISGSVEVNGNLDTPRTGVGACTAGTPTAFTGSGSADLNGEIVQLPQAKTYPTPNLPDPLPPTSGLTINSSTTCADITGTSGWPGLPAACAGAAGNLIITTDGATLSFGNVAMSGGATLTINGGLVPSVNLNVNTFSLAGNASIALTTGTAVVMNVAGQDVTAGSTVLDFTGGALTNGSYDSSKFQILYAGTDKIKVGGGSDTAATIYAPNAFVDMSGNAGFYGSVLSNTFKDNGGASVHYDRSLASKYFTLGQHVMSSFSWQKY